MKIYLVGGAVRDRLLGLPVHERDWVVVGARPEELIDQGFRPVGRDFPVFLHPETGEEYALARTERKTGAGYHGFATHFAPDVTLEGDLARRDRTINAIAEDPETGALIDPWGGRQDIAARVLRHVSPAFVEDPLRVLRVARFAARYHRLGFSIAPETLELMRRIAQSGELAALVPERVWNETSRALSEPDPQVYFASLRACGALVSVFPEVEALFGVPQPAEWHPEVDTGLHTLMVLEQAARLTSDPVVRFAALTHDLGKGTTPRAEWPRHRGHEVRSVNLLHGLSDRLRVPNEFRQVAALVARHHGVVHRALELRDSTVLDLLEQVDALRRPARFEQFLLACEADMRGRTGFEQRPYPQAALLRSALQAAASVELPPEALASCTGVQIAAQYRAARLATIRAARAEAHSASGTPAV